MNNKQELYESPELEVIEVNLDSSIAVSGKSGVSLWEQLWGE